ncbi:MAG: hypothetical protein LH468_09025 [Nocardioides sp.]|nr:hypothetical protein [Nocardioides sp.]
MSLTQEFADRVRVAAEGTPYAVTDVEGGFDLRLELVDAQWWGVLNRAGLRRTFTHEVRIDETDRSFSVTDVSRDLEWVAGTPRISARGGFQRGRILSRRRETIWAFDDSGRPAKVVDYRFDSEEGRDLAVTVGRRLELTQHRGTAERMGLVMGVIGGAGAVLTVLVLLVLLLLGRF